MNNNYYYLFQININKKYIYLSLQLLELINWLD